MLSATDEVGSAERWVLMCGWRGVRGCHDPLLPRVRYSAVGVRLVQVLARRWILVVMTTIQAESYF